MHFKGYKIRIYPTKEQEEMIKRHIGACRFIWNYMIEKQIERRNNKEKRITGNEMISLATQLRKEENYSWMKDISSNTLHLVCIDLNHSYEDYFSGKINYPKYKSKKKSKNIFPTRTDAFRFEKGKVFIEKIGWIKYKSDFKLPEGRGHKFYNANVRFENGKYMVSFCIECENQTFDNAKGRMGIDLGVKKTAIVAFEDKKIEYDNINKSKKIHNIENRKNYYHKQLSRKCRYSYKNNKEYKPTKNIEKILIKLRKCYNKLTNIRNNYNHKISHDLVSMQPEQIVIETLNLSRLLKNKHRSKMIRDQSLYSLIEMLKYKCTWNNVKLVQADEFFPSSKRCSNCGFTKKKLLLTERLYICDNCGLVIDRDYNAALNLMRYEA